MRAALLVFGLALVTGQQFQDNYKTTSTAVVLAGPGYFQRHIEDFQRRQFSNDFQEERLRKASGTRQNLQGQNYRGDAFQKTLFASSLFRSSDADSHQSFDDQFRSGGFRQSERNPKTYQYGRYQGDQRRRFQQNGREDGFQQNNREDVFQQNSQNFFQQDNQDNQFQRDNQQIRFTQNSRGNRFNQAGQENRFQMNRPRSFFQLNSQDNLFRQNNQDNLFRQNNQDNRFNRNNRAGRFQLNTKDAQLRHGAQDNFSQRNNRNNQFSSTFVGENRPFHSRFSEDNTQRNSFSQQGQRFRGSHFGQVDSRFLERDFDVASLPAGAQFRLDSVDTSFQCARRPYGFYADQSSGCRVFHVCNPDLFVDGHSQNLQSSFMCGEGYIFDQRRRACVQEHLALPCHEASNYYFTNDN